MKNIVFALALAVSFLFFSCSNEESDATNGILDLTIVNDTYHYPVTEFVYDNSSTLIEGRSGTDGIQIRFEGKAVKKYTLGLCSTADSIGICMDNAETVSNTVSYKDPSDNRQYSVVCGTLTIRDYTSENVEVERGFGPVYGRKKKVNPSFIFFFSENKKMSSEKIFPKQGFI